MIMMMMIMMMMMSYSSRGRFRGWGYWAAIHSPLGEAKNEK